MNKATIRYADILKDVKPEWSAKEKARYIYIEICKKSIYDAGFIYTKSPEVARSIYEKTVDVDDEIIASDAKYTCRTLNEDIYSVLLSRVGVRNHTIGKPSKIRGGFEDKALIFYDEDGTPYFTAIAADIQRCRYGLKTQYFGGRDDNYPDCIKENVVIIEQPELEEIDEKVGYIGDDKIYTDEFFKLLSGIVKQNNDFKKYVLQEDIYLAKDFLISEGYNLSETAVKEYAGQNNIINQNEAEKRMIEEYFWRLRPDQILRFKMQIASFATNKTEEYGPSESKKHSEKVLKSILNKKECSIFNSFDMVKDRDDGSIDYISIIRFDTKPQPLYYRYNEEEHVYELLDIEEALELTKDYREANNKKMIKER